jgi:LmbE family N-acetylglucosaminyl deacetylase
MITWWILSPHPDDAVLSLGGFMLEAKARSEVVHVISVYDYSSDFKIRQQEDASALKALDVIYHSFGMQDAPIRNASYSGYSGLLLHESPDDSCQWLKAKLLEFFPKGNEHRVLVPLAIGGHIDHVNVYEAAKEMAYGFYADMPYAASTDFCSLRSLERINSTHFILEDWPQAELPFFSSIALDLTDFSLFKSKLKNARPKAFDNFHISSIRLDHSSLLNKWNALSYYRSQLSWIFGEGGQSSFMQQNSFQTEFILTLEGL